VPNDVMLVRPKRIGRSVGADERRQQSFRRVAFGGCVLSEDDFRASTELFFNLRNIMRWLSSDVIQNRNPVEFTLPTKSDPRGGPIFRPTECRCRDWLQKSSQLQRHVPSFNIRTPAVTFESLRDELRLVEVLVESVGSLMQHEQA